MASSARIRVTHRVLTRMPNWPQRPWQKSQAEYCRNLLIENGKRANCDSEVLQANGAAGCRVAVNRANPCWRTGHRGSRKGPRDEEFIAERRQMKVIPHVAQNTEDPSVN